MPFCERPRRTREFYVQVEAPDTPSGVIEFMDSASIQLRFDPETNELNIQVIEVSQEAKVLMDEVVVLPLTPGQKIGRMEGVEWLEHITFSDSGMEEGWQYRRMLRYMTEEQGWSPVEFVALDHIRDNDGLFPVGVEERVIDQMTSDLLCMACDLTGYYYKVRGDENPKGPWCSQEIALEQAEQDSIRMVSR
jgi:hypothetical protein